MAENEFYRAEIVIDINDESAVQRIRRAENRVNQALDGMERRGRALSRMEISPILSIHDRATSRARQISNTLSGLTSRAWTVTIHARDEVSKVTKRITDKLKTPLGVVGMGAVTLGPGLFAAHSLGKAMYFEAQMSSIKALTGLTGKEMNEIQSLAMKMGAKTKYSALEAAQGMEELLKAGLTPAAVKAGGLEAALNLATAGGLELADAAEIMSTAMNAYKDDAMTAADAANILAGTANASATSVQELRYSLAAVSAVASGMGMSFKDTNIALGLFANNGLKGSDAGTSLKTMLSNLQPSTDKQAELFKKLGIITESGANKFYTAEGRLKSLDKISGILHDSFKDMTNQQRSFYLEMMFGSDAVRAGTILYKEGADGVKKFGDEMLKVTALDVAKEKMNNASGAVEQLQGAIETLQISAMLPFLPTVKKLAEAAADFSDKFGPKITKSMEDAATKIDKFYNRLSNDKAFQKMDWGDKIVYVLDQMMIGMDNWVSGPGGKQAEKVFTKLAEIATRAWLTAIGGMFKGSADALMSGNIVGAGGLAMGGAVLGGGMLIRGGIGAGKGIYKGGKWVANKFGYGGAARAVEATTEVAATAPAAVSSARIPAASVAPITEATSGASRASRALSVFGKVASKVALPLAVATEAYDIYKAKDKTTATVRAAGGLGGGWAGAGIGAAIGTAILPGIGTAVGAALGGIGGYVAGKWGAGKLMGEGRPKVAEPAAIGDSFINNQAKAFKDMSQRSGSWGRTLIANFCAGRDSAGMNMNGWLSSQIYSPFASIVDRATSWGSTLMNNFAAGMQSVKIAQPTIPTPSIAAAPVTAHAAGGILTRPHLGLVAEAGPEAIIPLSSGRRSQALQLWQQAGEMLGVVPHAEGGIFGSLKRFFSSDKVQAAGNSSEYAAVGLESTRGGYEKAVHGIHKNYDKKIAKADAIEEAEKVRRIAHQAKNLSKKFNTITKTLSRIAIPLALFASAAEIIGSSDKKQTLVKELGSTLGAIAGGALAGAAGGALVGAGIASPLTALIGAAAGAGLGAFGGQAAASNIYSRFAKHADGGVLTRPHLGLVAEAGPEAIIPLSSGRRGKAIDLWQQTGEMLGVRPYALGGFAGTVPAIAGGYVAPVPAVPMSTKGGGQSSVSIAVDGVNINMSEKEMEIDEDGLALRIGRKIVKSIKQAYENRD